MWKTNNREMDHQLHKTCWTVNTVFHIAENDNSISQKIMLTEKLKSSIPQTASFMPTSMSGICGNIIPGVSYT